MSIPREVVKRPPCPKCDETMERHTDVAGNDTHEWPCWWWECPWCGHEGRTHHRQALRWPVQTVFDEADRYKKEARMTRTICSGCMAEVVIEGGQAVAIRPSNGVRGVHHRPATPVVEMTWEEDGVIYWDCPLCHHPDSFDPSA